MAKVQPLVAVFSAIDNISSPIRNIKENIESLSKELKASDKEGFAAFKEAMKDAQSSLDDFKSNIADTASSIGVAVAGWAVAVGAGAFASVAHFADVGGAIDDTVQRLGVGAQSLQEWQYAALRAGSSPEAMNKALEKLGKTMQDVADGGNKSAAELFTKLNISITTADGTLRDTTDVMSELAKGFEANENGALRTAMAMTLLGKSGAELVPLLASGTDGVQEFVDEARELGLILSDDEVGQAAELGDYLDRMTLSFGMLSTKMGAALAPAAKIFAESMTKVFGSILTNQELMGRITSTFERFATQLATIDFAKIITEFLDLTSSVIDVINAIGGLKTIFIALGGFFVITKFIVPLVSAFRALSVAMALIKVSAISTIFTAMTGTASALLTALGSLVKVMFSLAGGALVAVVKGLQVLKVAVVSLVGSTGIGLLLVALGAIGVWCYANWDTVTNWFDNIKEKLKPLLDAVFSTFNNIKAIFNSLITTVAFIFTSVWQSFNSFIEYLSNTSYLDILTNAFTSSFSLIKNVFVGYYDFITSLWSNIIDFFLNLSWIQTLKSTFSEAISFIAELIQSIFDKFNNIVSAVSDVKTSVSESFAGAVDSVKDFFGFGSDDFNNDEIAMSEVNAPAIAQNKFSNPNLNGALDINIRTDAGTTAEVVKTQEHDLKITSNLGEIR